MNLLGKIFTVCIALAAFGLMVLSISVYSTHRNWREDYNALNQKLQAAQAANSELETRYTNQISQLKAEQEAAQQDVRKLETERVALVNENTAIHKQVDQLSQDSRGSVALVRATEENNTRLMKDVIDLRSSIRENQQARDEAFATTLKATTDLHVTTGQLEEAKERNGQLVSQLAQKTAALREGGIDENAEVVPRVRGVVSAIHPADGGQLIEMSIGSDDGIKPGQTVEVFRGDRYLGRAEVLKTDPDRAVARVIRQYQVGQIQEGDDVSTKLRNG